MELRYELLFICLLALISSGWAARRVDANVRARDTMKRRRDTAVMKRQEPGTLDTKALLQLTEGESVHEVRTSTDVHGTTVERLQLTYKGVPVFDSSVTVRKDDKGHLTGDASGTLIQDIADDLKDTEQELTDEQTLDIVIKEEGDEDQRGLIGDVEYQHFVYLDSGDKARLVSRVSYMIDGIKKPMYIIDLKSGEVLDHWNSFMTLSCCHESPVKVQLIGGNEKMGKVMYGSQPYCLDFSVNDCDVCYLENKYVRVVDMEQTENENITETASFPCKEIYDDPVNGAYSPAIDSFFHGTVVGKMFEEWYDDTALSDKMIIRVHFGQNYSNAFWNSMNATFGDGGYMFYPLTSMDVVGHEFGHGVVEQGSGLLYFGESGGMNEAFADIMGEATEEFFLTSDFMTGPTIMRNEPYMREFETPENDNYSISRADQMTPTMDPHLSSGVYRRIWYVVTKEQGMAIKDAFRVFLYANKMYWHYVSTFYDGSCGLLKAAMDLGMDTAPFAIAFEDVGIPKCNVSSHIVGLSNNKTQKRVSVTETIQPVFAFSVPSWAKSIYVEAITPSLGEIHITLLKGTWEEEEYDSAKIVAEGTTKLEYVLQANETEQTRIDRDYSGTTAGYPTNGSTDYYSENPPPEESTRHPESTAYGSTENAPWESTAYPEHSTGGHSEYPPTEYSTSGQSENYTTTEYPSWNYTTAEPTALVEDKFFIKLSTEYFYDYFNDVEVTVGYVCLDSYTPSDFMAYMIYRYYCFGDM